MASSAGGYDVRDKAPMHGLPQHAGVDDFFDVQGEVTPALDGQNQWHRFALREVRVLMSARIEDKRGGLYRAGTESHFGRAHVGIEIQ
jgi:hypothetical protein